MFEISLFCPRRRRERERLNQFSPDRIRIPDSASGHTRKRKTGFNFETGKGKRRRRRRKRGNLPNSRFPPSARRRGEKIRGCLSPPPPLSFFASSPAAFCGDKKPSSTPLSGGTPPPLSYFRGPNPSFSSFSPTGYRVSLGRAASLPEVEEEDLL